ncbi:MAG: ABC transporter permease [Bacillota bacterium]|nr:ABC transporter permease [Bacillota bacterium]
MAIVFAAMTLITPRFLTVDNMLGLALEMCILLIVACGMTFVILTGGIDLSVSSVFAFSGILVADVLRRGAPPLVGLVVGLLSGALVGWTNGFLITKGAVPPFISTLALMTAARGVALVYSKGYPIGIPIESRFLLLGSAKIFGIPFPIIVALVVFLISYVILSKTHFGRDVYAVGGNLEAARLSGIRIHTVITWAYVLSGLFASVGAMIYAARLYTGLPSAGRGAELNAIAAVVLGGTSLSGGEGTIAGTLLGVLLMATLTNGMVLLGISADFQYIVQGAVIVFAIQFDRWRKKYRDV